MGTGARVKKYCKYAILPALALLLSLPAARRARAAFGEGAAVALEVAERMTSDLSLPPVTFRVRNNFRQADPFRTEGEDPMREVSAWQIQIFDQGGRKVGYIQGGGAPGPSPIPWPGLSNSGETLPDGFYKARFVWLDAARRPRSTDAATVSLSTPPEMRELSALKLQISYGGEGLLLTFRESRIFNPGEARIKPEAAPALRGIARFLGAYPRKQVLVRGHTDASGSPRRNWELSGERAAGVCRFLRESGVDGARLKSEGRGPDSPVASNETEAGRARNRRVEIILLKTAG